MQFSRLILVVVLAVLLPCAGAANDAPQPKLSYLDNKTIKIGVDLNLGGAISYLSLSGTDNNVVNNHDWGRQIQMSHYSGPSPLRLTGKEPAPAWANFGWNPVQAGDAFGNPSKLLDTRNDGKELYVKSVPMQWSYNKEPCECTFETWITLDGATARVRCRVTNARTDRQQYPAHDQELPAVYVNAPYFRVLSYTGAKPFTQDALSRIEKTKNDPPKFPWARFQATENWAALVNADDWGLGIWQPRAVTFLGGFVGKPGKGGTKDSATGYLAPIRQEILDHNIVYEHDYVLILGTLKDIRRKVYDLAGKPALPGWKFTNERQGWTYAGTTDTGWPIKGELNVALTARGAALTSPVFICPAVDAPVLSLDAALKTTATQGKIYWTTLANPTFAEERSVTFPLKGDGSKQTYKIRLGEVATYTGTITRLRLVPGGTGAADEKIRLQAVTLHKEAK